MRKGHPLLDLLSERSALEPEDITGIPQVEFSYPTQENLQPDPVLRDDSGSTESTLSVPFFTAMPFIVADTDAVAPVPGRFGALLARDYNVAAVPYRLSRGFPYPFDLARARAKQPGSPVDGRTICRGDKAMSPR